MPAPKLLAALPKPVLFGLYGAAGGLLGALIFGELLYRLLTPPQVQAAPPEPQVAVAASPEVEVFVEGRNSFPVKVARDAFEGPIAVRLEGLPPGVTAEPLSIPANKTEGEVTVVASSRAQASARPVKVVAEGGPEGHRATAGAAVTLKVTDPPRPLADVAFVLDVTSSMQWAIDDLKNGIGKFAESLAKARIDFRLALVTFQDVTNPGEKVEVVQFKGGPFTADAGVFRDEVSRLKASGGGDIPESSLEGVKAACDLPFRKDATKVLLLITDAPPKVARFGDPETAVRQTADRVRDANIDAVHTVVHRLDQRTYEPLTKAGADKAGGKYFNLSDVVRGDEGFDAVLTTFGTAVTAAAIAKNPAGAPRVAPKSKEEPKLVRSLQSSETTAAGSEGRIVLRSGVWTGAVAALVCLALLAGQHHYLRGTLPPVGGVVAGLLGGLVVGLVGGAAGQGLFFLAPESAALAHAFRVFGWALLGGLAGVGLSLFIPNMKWAHGLLGGAIGGAAGAVGFILVSSATGELVGRLVGGLVLGLGIGLMVAVAETAFRRAWLEVRYGGREKITVTLGSEPVKVGSDAKACTVWARGAPPVAMRFFVRDGRVICDDLTAGRESAVGDGFEKEVGTLTVTVRTGSGGSPAPAPERRERPIAKPKKEAAPLSLDDDDFNLPMPAPSAAPAAPPARPAPANPPRPASTPPKPPVPSGTRPPVPPSPKSPAPKPVIPPVAPAIKSTAKNPDACPGCGRAVPGKPGTRYCMICDQTF
jgi:Mg-chelatase subunit ChlD